MRIPFSAFLSLVLVAGATAAGSWHVRVNESIAGVRLGMTRAQVAARMRPLFCFQRVGGVAKLKREFGRRLIGPVWNRGRDELFYEVIGRRGGRRVQSAFAVDRESPPPYRGSAVIAAYISFCGRQAANVPRCPRHG